MTRYNTHSLLVNDSLSFFGSSPSGSQALSILFLQKITERVMYALHAPVSSCIMEADILNSQTAFYFVKKDRSLSFARKVL